MASSISDIFMWRYHNIGSSLLVILIFLLVTSLFCWEEYASVITVNRLLQHRYEAIKSKEKINYYLLSIANKQAYYHLSCRMPILSWNRLKQLSKNWWHQHACHLNDEYYYIYEPLQSNRCLYLDKKTEIRAEFYRITVFAKNLITQRTL